MKSLKGILNRVNQLAAEAASSGAVNFGALLGPCSKRSAFGRPTSSVYKAIWRR